ncbi:MAG: FAD-binding oxidoreductase [Pseudomonadota bacterium]
MNIIAELTDLLGDAAVIPPEKLDLRDPGVVPENGHGVCGVAPADASEAQALFRWATKTGTPVVPQGGRTGLAGGAAGHNRAVLLLTHRLARQIDVDPVSSTALLSSNVTLAQAESSARQHGLSLGIDLGARDSCMIGGMISTNAGGMEAFRNGQMRQRVLGLEAVMPDGTLMSDLSRVRKCNEGYDIKQLLIGAEGTLGLVTTACLQLVPAPPPSETALIAAHDALAALAIFHRLQKATDLTVLRAEAMWPGYFELTAELNDQGDRIVDGAGLYLLLELVGDPVDEALFAHTEADLETGAVLDITLAASQSQANDLWRIREDSFAISRRHPHSLWFDVSVPLAELDDYVAQMRQRVIAIDDRLDAVAIAHLGDGNLHITVGYPEPFSNALANAVKPAIFDGIKARGGAFSAEHGIGTEKAAVLSTYGDPGKRVLMERIKTAFDPAGICNPGKVLA